MLSREYFSLLSLSMAASFHTGLHAQALPDAGSLRQQIEQQRDLQLPQAVRPGRVTLPKEIKAPVGITVRPQSFRLIGNQLLNTEQLTQALAEFVGRELDFNDLQRACDTVAAVYREEGWIARVYLPEQDISTGVITLQVVEANFGGVRFEGEATQRVNISEVEAFLNTSQTTGQPLNADALDRALLLADDLPGVSVAGTLAPGKTVGEILLMVQTTDEPNIYGDISLDNAGTRSTGSERITANFFINSPARRGDLFNATVLHSRGSDYGRVAYSLPYGYDGLRLGVSASDMHYKVINGTSANSVARIEGRSDSKGFDWSYPILRTRLQNLYTSGGIERKKFFTQDMQVRSDYESQSLLLSLSGNRFDDLGGGGANAASLQLTAGRLLQMHAHTLKDTIDRSYNKLNYSLSRQQTLTASHSVLLSMQAQHATQALDSSEKFYIGGPSTVRAYPTSELGAERGHAMSVEWRWRLHAGWLLSAFIDNGRVVSLPATASERSSTLTLRGHGFGVNWQTPQGGSVRLTWAHRDGTNPRPTQAGTDGDGTLRLNRWWLATSMPF